MRHRFTTGTILRVGLSAGLLAVLIGRIDGERLVDLIGSVNKTLFAAGLGLYLLTVVSSALRWQLVLKAEGITVPFRDLAEINLVGALFANFLPTAAGGDLVRMYELARQSGRSAQGVSTVIVERTLGLVSLALMALAAVSIGYHHVGERVALIVILSCTLALVILGCSIGNPQVLRHLALICRLPLLGALAGQLQSFQDSLLRLQRQRMLASATILLSLALQGIEVVSVILIARALDIQASSLLFLVFVPLIWVITMAPVSLNGLGIREGAFALVFGQVGVVPAQAVALSLLVYSCRLLAGVLGGAALCRRAFFSVSAGDVLESL